MQNKPIIKVVYGAILVALDVLLSRVLAINTPIMKIGLGFISVAISGALFGPVWAGVLAALGDFMGAIIFPTGAYYLPFTLTAALSGVIFGLFLKNYSRIKALIVSAVNTVVVTCLLNTYFISLLSGAAYKELFITRIPQFIIMFALQSVVLTTIFPKMINAIVNNTVD